MKHRALLAAAPLAAALLLASPAPAYDDDTLGICFNTFVLFTGPTSGFCRQDKDCAPIPAPLVQICEKNNICVDNRGFPTGPTCASAEECGVGQS